MKPPAKQGPPIPGKQARKPKRPKGRAKVTGHGTWLKR